MNPLQTFSKLKRYFGTFLFFWVTLLSLTGCSHTPLTEALLADPATVSPSKLNSNSNQNPNPNPNSSLGRFELTQVPFFKQKSNYCGPASLATVLNYYAVGVTPDDLVSQVYVPEKQGALQIEMTAAVRQFGLLAYPVKPSLIDILAEINAGNPVLVMQNLGLDWTPFWHYAVVVGYDIEARQFILRSGDKKRRLTDFRAFENTWKRSNYWGLVINRPDQVNVTAELVPWMKAAADLQAVGQMSAAEKAYLAAKQYWPNKKLPGFVLSNLYYQQGDYAKAVAGFSELVKQFPDDADIWNNYAFVLQASGCPKQANLALQCGLQKDPNNQNLLASQTEIQQELVNSNMPIGLKNSRFQCPVEACF